MDLQMGKVVHRAKNPIMVQSRLLRKAIIHPVGLCRTEPMIVSIPFEGVALFLINQHPVRLS
jgi:hypothetical protein